MTTDPDKKCVLFFVKSPTTGRVKTRLAQDIGPANSAGLYKSFVLDILTVLTDLDTNLKICFDPPQEQDALANWLGNDFSYLPQKGRNLGARMKNAFKKAFADGFEQVVLVGSDIPDLPADFVSQAFAALDTHDAVIGPSTDGGYYLIGFSRETFLPSTLDGITWSTESVLKQTLSTFNKYKRKPYMLPRWHDVDDARGLNKLIARAENTGFQNSGTMAFLSEKTPWILDEIKSSGDLGNVLL
jgi:rSAM/selenodomain-associated transferase 1